jgi:E3 ubiquitin-protein ligase DCST1
LKLILIDLKMRKKRIINFRQIFKRGRELSHIEYLLNGVKSFSRNHFTVLSELLFSKDDDYSLTRSIISFMNGTIYGVAIYYFTIYQIEGLSKTIHLLLLSIILSICSIGMSMFAQMRCIMTLSIFNFTTSGVRLIVTGYLITNILNGPVNLIIKNSQALTDSVSCQINLMSNLSNINIETVSTNKNLLETVKQNHVKLKNDSMGISNMLATMKDEYYLPDFKRDFNDKKNLKITDFNYEYESPVETTTKKSSVEYEEESKQIDNNYYQKNIDRCIEMFVSGEKNCNNTLRASQETTSGNIIDKQAGKQIFQTAEFLNTCNIKVNQSYQKRCEEKYKRNNTEGVGNDSLILNEINSDFSQSFEIEFNDTYDIKENKKLVQQRYKIIKENSNKLKAQFNVVSEWIKLVIRIFKTLSSFAFIFVFINSYKYHAKFTNDITFDNIFITQYFRLIDARRIIQKKRHILPLRRQEGKELKYPGTFYISSYQKSNITINVIIYFILILIIVLSISVNFIFVDFISIIRDKALINYQMLQQSRRKFSIQGDSALANIIRSVTTEIDQKNEKVINGNTKACIPIAYSLNTQQQNDIIKQILTILFVIIVEIYLKRFNRNICVFYNRKLEKKRIIWLYNDLLAKRKLFVENSIEIILKKKKKLKLIKKKQQQHVNILIRGLKAFRNKMPSVIGKLIDGIFFKKHCLSCSVVTYSKNRICSTCEFVYCRDCWYDFDQECIYCLPDYDQNDDNKKLSF